MEKNSISNQQDIHKQHPCEKIGWANLSDTQKTQLLLESTRMLDFKHFINEFESFEYPKLKIKSAGTR